jgi:hypothetical protein
MPYALDHRTGEWTLRPDMMDTLEQVCEPTVVVNEKKPTPRPTRKSIGAKRKTKRKTI